MRKPLNGVSPLRCLVLANADPAGALQGSMPAPPEGCGAPAIFRDLFFGVGPVASLFPEIWDEPAIAPPIAKIRSMPETPALIDRIIGRVDAHDPERLARFASDVQSGGHVRVSKTREPRCSRRPFRKPTSAPPAQTCPDSLRRARRPSPRPSTRSRSCSKSPRRWWSTSPRDTTPTPREVSPLENDVLVDMIATRLATNAS